ncbi:NfeD family protein [Priestia aryabhattai]|uniref:NfeD family protein n=1 Tax=Priestia aryabhattai TaxID=412384 RepID=A0AAX6NCD4_PRIAR|nr:NfeD family protein [Priestia aryabhattai]MDU9693522.1 NfeD family protein [Priestia aryabhattai]
MEIWLVLAVLFLIIEFSTPGLFFGLFFAIASFITYFISLILTDNFWVLVAAFALLSIVAIYALRPVLIKRFKINETVRPSNIEAFIMKEGIVTEKIETNKNGRVNVESESWLAKSLNNTEIKEDTIVKIEMIDGTTLVVYPKD